MEIGILDIDKKDILPSLLKKITDHEWYTYMDTNDLLEHLYGVDRVIEEAQEAGVPLNSEESLCLEAISVAMAVNDCAYFRIPNS